jgi:hypothetical protein
MSDISHIQVDNTVYDLKDNVARETKAPLASPSLTGNPTAPTQSEGDNSTKLATTAYVDRGLSNKENTIIQTSTGPIAHFEDGLDVNMVDVKCAIEPVQDLHGYDNPCPAGGGKNLLPITLSILKANNTFGTWADNVYTYNNVTFTVSVNAEGYVTKIVVNGTASSSAPFVLTETVTHNEWIGKIVNGAPEGSGYSNSYISIWNKTDNTDGGVYDMGSGMTIPDTLEDKLFRIYISVSSGKTNSNRVFYPMLRLSTITDATFAPYSNVCPITGWTGANVTRTGKNLLPNNCTSGSQNGLTWTVNSDGSVTISGTANNPNSTYTTITFDYANPLTPIAKGSCRLVCSAEASYNPSISGLRFQNDIYVDGIYVRTMQNNESSYPFNGGIISVGTSRLKIDNGTVIPSGTKYYPQIEFGYTATSYEPYQGDIHSISWQTEAGTVYGGTLNVTTGELTVDRVLTTLDGSENWYEFGSNQYGQVYSCTLPYTKLSQNSSITKIISDKFKIVSGLSVVTPTDDETGILANGGAITACNFFVRFDFLQNLTAWTTWLSQNPTQVSYLIAEPITYQLSPTEVKTLPGINNIFADTGDTTAKYWKNSDIANYIDNHKAVLEQMTGYKRYGVKGVGQAASALTRTYDAVGMEANVGSKTLKVNNDFDNAPPFHRRKCVGYWEKNLAHEKRAVFHVLKYEGDDGYTEDGTMGDYVAVECPRCYYKLDGDELIISAHRYDGYRAFDIFCHEHNQNDTMEYYYMPAYPLAMKDGHAVSLPGLRNEQGDWATLYNKTKTYNNSDIAQLAQLMPAAVNFYEWALMTVEFATQNIQDIIYGVAGCYNGENNSGQFTSLENTITFECNDNLTGIIAGDYIGIGNYNGGTDYRTYTSHKVLSATSYNSKRILTLEETGWSNIEYNSTSTYYISGRHVPTGLTEDILTPSGVENHTTTASHNAMRYRYHENCYGNQFHTSADLFDVAMIIPNATTTSVNVKYGASLDWYYLPDPTSITTATNPTNNTTSLSSDDRFVKLGVFTPSENYASGYIVSKKYDLDYPDIWIPNVTENGSASTYFADYAYLVSSYVCRSVRFGGSWSSGAHAGPSSALAHNPPSNSLANYGGDLYFPQ